MRLKKFNCLIFLLLFILSLVYTKNVLAQEFPNNLDIIILVDLSGSMEFSLDGTRQPTPKPSRWSYIKPGLDALATIFQRIYDPKDFEPPGGGVSSRRFAFGRFPGNSSENFSWLKDNIINLTDLNLRAYNEDELTNIIADLSIRWAGTPIGTAIKRGVEMFNSHPYLGSGTTGSIIFLFTDGKRYGGEEIYDKIDPSDPFSERYSSGNGTNHLVTEIKNNIDGSNFIKLDTDPINTDTNPAQDDDHPIKIVSLGFGDNSTASTETDFKMLEDISKYPGVFIPGLTDFTKESIYTAFSTLDYASGWTDPNFEINPMGKQEHLFHVTKYDRRLLFLVSWSEPKTDSIIKFSLRDPSGRIITSAIRDTNIIYDEGETFQVFTINGHYIENNPGEWMIIINGENLVKPEVYSYSVFGHSALHLKDISAHAKRAKYTGDKIQLQVSLKANENVIQDATVTASITSPKDGAGNWFAGYPLTPLQLDSVKNIKFPGHVENVYKKFYYMKHLNNVSLPGTNTFKLPLTFDSQDSLYKGTTTPLTKAGIYKIEISAVNDPLEDSLLFRRDVLKYYFIEVRPNLDWTFSLLEFKKIKNENLNNFDAYKLKFTPKDQFQNFVKPGKEDHISYKVKNATLSTQPIDDDLQGSYYKDIVVPSNTLKPKVTVQFDNFTFVEQPITDNLKGDNWRFYPDGLSIHIGSVIPLGTTDSLYSGNLYGGLDYFRQLNKNWAINGIIGYSKFKGKINNPDLEYWNFSINVRWYPVVQNAFRFFINTGGGYYLTGKSSNNDFGFNAGAGFSVPLSPQIEIEAGGNYHNIILIPNFTFIQIYGGLLIRF